MELKNEIIAEIKKIYDPEIPVNIYELGLIYDIKVENNNTAKVKMTLTSAIDNIQKEINTEKLD